MNLEKIKLIVKNMDLLIQSLKDEIRLEENRHQEIISYIKDYDEVYDENEE